MSAVPRLNQWCSFVRPLGGLVGLDVTWQDYAWAEFPDREAGPITVICKLDGGGDLDIASRPRLEGANIRNHPRIAQALAALAYVNPAAAGNGAQVSRDRHRGDWYQLDENLGVAVAVGGNVGGAEVNGRGAFLVHKGRIWLPHGEQTPSEREAPRLEPEAEPSVEHSPESDASVQSAPAQSARNGDEPTSPRTIAAADNVSVLPRPPARQNQSGSGRRPARIFGDEADDLINQARSAGRRRA